MSLFSSLPTYTNASDEEGIPKTLLTSGSRDIQMSWYSAKLVSSFYSNAIEPLLVIELKKWNSVGAAINETMTVHTVLTSPKLKRISR